MTAAGAPRFAALHVCDDRWYFFTSLTAMTADNTEHVISYWVIFQKFHSPALGGFAVISHWVPFLLFSVFAGALADRYDCRTLIQGGEALRRQRLPGPDAGVRARFRRRPHGKQAEGDGPGAGAHDRRARRRPQHMRALEQHRAEHRPRRVAGEQDAVPDAGLARSYGVAVALLVVAGMLNIAFSSMAQTL